jgi:hypothetical protein
MTGWVCTAAITIKVLNPSRSKGFAAAPAVEIWRAIVAKAAEELVRRDRRFADSPLEGDGFELLVPRHKSRGFPQHSGRIGGALKRYHLMVQPFFFCASNHSIEPGWGTV